MENETTLFIPIGYGKGTVIQDIDKEMWLVGETVIEPIHKVTKIEKELAQALLDKGAKFLVATKK